MLGYYALGTMYLGDGPEVAEASVTQTWGFAIMTVGGPGEME